MGDKKRRFELSPELGDGSSRTVVDTIEQLCDAIRAWGDEVPHLAEGEGFSVLVAEMTDEEVDALPEV